MHNRPSTRRIEKTLSRSLLAVISVLLSFVVLELVSNLYLFQWADRDEFKLYATLHQLEKSRSTQKHQYAPHRYLSYYPMPNYKNGKNRHNALGYRGDEIVVPKPPGRFRIACLGGSTTYTVNVRDYRKSYPYVLGQYLREKGFSNVEVINAGVNGWSSWESLINLEFRVLDLDPDLVIVYHGINDIQTRLVWPPEAYRGDNSGYRHLKWSGVFMPSVFEHSTLLRITMIKTGIVQSQNSFARTVNRKPETSYASMFDDQKKRGKYPEAIFENTSAQEMLEMNRPVYFERNVRNMIAIAKSRGIEVVISSFAFSPLFAEFPKVSSDEYVYAHNENNHLLKMVAAETDVYFFDFASKFPTSRSGIYTDGRHVTENGAKLKAELFGAFLIENQIIK